jgi:hypothetical protein
MRLLVAAPSAGDQSFLKRRFLFGVVLGLVDLTRMLVEGPNGLTAPAPGAIIVTLVLAIFLGAGVGAALGALGGVFGKRWVARPA